MKVTADHYFEIVQLFARYAHAIDSGDGAGWAGCYMPDGEYVSSTFGTCKGSANLGIFAEDHYRRWMDQGIQTRHWNNHTVIERLSASEFATKTYVLLLGVRKSELPKPLLQTVYSDVLVSTEGGLRLRRRQSIADMLPDPSTFGFSKWDDSQIA